MRQKFFTLYPDASQFELLFNQSQYKFQYLYSTWFLCCYVISEGNSLAIKQCTCLFNVGFSQAINRSSIILLRKDVFPECDVPCVYIGDLNFLRGGGLAPSYGSYSRALLFAMRN